MLLIYGKMERHGRQIFCKMEKDRGICFTQENIVELCPEAKLGWSFPCSGILLSIV